MARGQTRKQRRERLQSHLDKQTVWPSLYRIPEDGEPLAMWDKFARLAFRIEDPPDDRPGLSRWNTEHNAQLRRLFADHRLDPVDPMSWRLVVEHYALVEYGFPKTGARKAKPPSEDITPAMIEAARKRLVGNGERATNRALAAKIAGRSDVKIGISAIRKRISAIRKTGALDTD